MINQVMLKNFGPLDTIDWKNLGAINLIIGGNGSGKTFLLIPAFKTAHYLTDSHKHLRKHYKNTLLLLVCKLH